MSEKPVAPNTGLWFEIMNEFLEKRLAPLVKGESAEDREIVASDLEMLCKFGTAIGSKTAKPQGKNPTKNPGNGSTHTGLADATRLSA